MKYNKWMDKECIYLCDAINSISKIKTTESCSGHGVEEFRIYFICNSLNNLYFVSRSMDIRYGGIYGWNLSANSVYDRPKKISFVITSGEFKGKEAYEQSIKIADNIYYNLEYLTRIKYWKIEK